MAKEEHSSPGAQPERSPAARMPARLRRKYWALAIAGLLLLAWIVHWAYFRWTHVYVDDARIDGEIITLSSRVSGWVTELPVIEGEVVKKGDLLFRIDDRDSRLQREVLVARLEAVEGEMAAVRARGGQVNIETQGRFDSESHRLKASEAEAAALAAQMKQARDDYERARELAAAKWLSPQAMERAHTAYQQAQENHRRALAAIAAARGSVAAAQGSRREVQVMQHQYSALAHQADEIRAEIRRRDIDIADRVISSPGDGRVVRTFVRRGEHVSAGQRILMFHDPQAIWVEANVKETDIAHGGQHPGGRLPRPQLQGRNFPHRPGCNQQVRAAPRSQPQRQLHQDHAAPARAHPDPRQGPAAAPGHDGGGEHCSEPQPLRSCSPATGRRTAGSRRQR
jgi:membrane fusion protein (multidrug efflux system)